MVYVLFYRLQKTATKIPRISPFSLKIISDLNFDVPNIKTTENPLSDFQLKNTSIFNNDSKT